MWVFAAASIVGSVLFTALMYANEGSYRYLNPLWVWPLVFSAAYLLHSTPIAARHMVATSLASLLFFILFAGFGRASIGILDWDQGVAVCLRHLRQGPSRLHAGLAEYWQARPIELAMRWSLQVDQIDEDGRALVWGNDKQWYRHAIHDSAVAPAYDFIILRKLRPDLIRKRYGVPDHVELCAGTEIWMYRDPTKLYTRLLADSPQLAAPTR